LKFSPQAGSILDVYHVSLLEPYVSNGRTVPEPTPPIKIDGENEYELEEVV
jgi:hypothetical protein